MAFRAPTPSLHRTGPLLLPGPQGGLPGAAFLPDWPFLWAGGRAGGERGACPVLRPRPVGAPNTWSSCATHKPVQPRDGEGSSTRQRCPLRAGSQVRTRQGGEAAATALSCSTPLPERPIEQPLKGTAQTGTAGRFQHVCPLALLRSALPFPPASASSCSDRSFLAAYPAMPPGDGASQAPLPKACPESPEERDASPPDVPPRSMCRARPSPPSQNASRVRGGDPPRLIW